MGLATAQLLAARGAIISLADINQEALEKAVASLPCASSHKRYIVDVSDSQAVDRWIQSTVQDLQRLDGAVNMAGVITHATPVADMDDATWDYNQSVNTRGVFACLRAQIKAMSGGGAIVCSTDTHPTPAVVRDRLSPHLCITYTTMSPHRYRPPASLVNSARRETLRTQPARPPLSA